MALSCAGLQSSATEEEWFQLLESILASIPNEVCVLIDLEIFNSTFAPLTKDFPWPSAFQGLFRSLSDRCFKTGQGPPSHSSYPAGFSKWLLRKCDSSQDSATRPEKTKGTSCGKEENGTVTEPQDWPTQRSSRIATQREANLNLQFSEDDSDNEIYEGSNRRAEVIAQFEVLEGTTSAEANEVRPVKF
ncbi:hypothetical protein ABVK25_002676 [Lepraria finkii]|uniref:Uncharacterized protein n=1 Tax=Lepraria finkii TaxID=1340010 RepID=A0ABR4BGI6_9LECA